MALNTIGDIQDEVLVRLGESTTTTSLAGVTDTILNDWTRQAHNFTSGYRKWPFTEGRVSTTWASTTEEWDFEGIKADSVRLLQIGGKRLQKLNFEDYQIFKEKSPSAKDRVYSDFGRLLFVNTSADVSGTMTAWAQYLPVIDPTLKTDSSIFTGREDEGNEAMVEEILSYAKRRQVKFQEAADHHARAIEILDRIWKNIQDEQSLYQTHPDRGGMFKRFNILRGSVSDEILKRDQF